MKSLTVNDVHWPTDAQKNRPVLETQDGEQEHQITLWHQIYAVILNKWPHKSDFLDSIQLLYNPDE